MGRKILATFLILIIVGGLGYITYSTFFMRRGGMNNMPQNMEMPQSSPAPNSNMSNMPNMPAQQNYAANSQAALNKDELNKSITLINQAVDMITIDPYSRTTVPNAALANIIAGQNPSNGSGTGTINIYPSANSSVNINPSVNGVTTTSPNQNALSPGVNFVFDQGKLYQLHNRIFLLAQGMMQLDELNNDLSNQAASLELNPPDYNTFINRYNAAVQNKSKLSNALNTLNQAFTLINLNPYAAPNGFQYNVQNMEQLHQGIYKLSQGLTSLSRLNDFLTRQMSEASLGAQSIANMSSTTMQTGWSIDPTTIISILLILVIIVVIISIFSAIRKAFNNGNGRNSPQNHESKEHEDLLAKK